MTLSKLKSWWRSLPSKKRVQWIASVLLIFAGTEVLVLAPAIIELAVLIDACGVLFVLSAVRTSLGASLMQLWTGRQKVLQPCLTAFRAAGVVADFGHTLPVTWLARYLAVLALAARMAFAASLVVFCFVLLRAAARASL